MLYPTLRVILRFLYRLLFRLQVIGVDNVPKSGPVLLCSNHISNLDPPALGLYYPGRLHFMAKEELFRIPVLNRLITNLGAFPVKRDRVSKEAIVTALKLLREGKTLGIFPEGSRKNPGIGKKGAAMLALRGNAAVVPAAIIGTYRPFSKLTIVYGKPVDLSEFAGGRGDELEAATDKIMKAIYEQIAEFRGDSEKKIR